MENLDKKSLVKKMAKKSTSFGLAIAVIATNGAAIANNTDATTSNGDTTIDATVTTPGTTTPGTTPGPTTPGTPAPDTTPGTTTDITPGASISVTDVTQEQLELDAFNNAADVASMLGAIVNSGLLDKGTEFLNWRPIDKGVVLIALLSNRGAGYADIASVQAVFNNAVFERHGVAGVNSAMNEADFHASLVNPDLQLDLTNYLTLSVSEKSELYVQMGVNDDASTYGDANDIQGMLDMMTDLIISGRGTADGDGAGSPVTPPDATPPQVMVMGNPVITAGQNVSVSSTEAGHVYLLRNTITGVQSVADLDTWAGTDSGAKAIVPATLLAALIDTTGLIAGTYDLYAADASGNIGTLAGAITIQSAVTSDVTTPTVTKVSNGTSFVIGDNVTVRSNEVGKVYLVFSAVTMPTTEAQLDALVTAGTAKSSTISTVNTDVHISTAGLVAGAYKIYGVDEAGNVAALTNSILLTPVAASTDSDRSTGGDGAAAPATNADRLTSTTPIENSPNTTKDQVVQAIETHKAEAAKNLTSPESIEQALNTIINNRVTAMEKAHETKSKTLAPLSIQEVGTYQAVIGKLIESPGEMEQAILLAQEIVERNYTSIGKEYVATLSELYDKAGKTEPKMMVDGKVIKSEVNLVHVEGNVLAPVRAVGEALNANVLWDKNTQTVTVTRNGVEVKLIIGSTAVTVNGQEITLDVPAKLENGRTYLSVHVIGEALSANVHYIQKSNLVIVEDRK